MAALVPFTPLRLYWMAVSRNVSALGILFHSVVNSLGRREAVLAVLLTAFSMVCWVLYFCKRKTRLLPKDAPDEPKKC